MSSDNNNLLVDPAVLSTIQPYDNKLNLSELVDGITSILSKCDINDKTTIDYNTIYKCMLSYDYTLNEWKRYEHYSPNKQYTRNLIATDYSSYSLMLLCWSSNSVSAIHDHSNAECFMQTVCGSICETQYYTPKQDQHELHIKQQKSTQLGDICFIDNSLGLHSVANSSNAQPACTLHLYIPSYDSCLLYDKDNCATKEAYVTYYSEHGEVVECE